MKKSDADNSLTVPGKGGALVPAGNPMGKKGQFLAKIRASKAVSVPVSVTPKLGGRQALVTAALTGAGGRPRLLFAFDATASRAAAWETAKKTTDSLFEALPGQLDVALAVHGGGAVHTFTEFTADPAALRDQAASVTCQAGHTRMLEILERATSVQDLKVVLYVGDAFEEDVQHGLGLADALRLRGVKLIVLHDAEDHSALAHHGQWFRQIAGRTRGAVLPFNTGSLRQLQDILEAIAVLAVGGVKLLQSRRKSLPGAQLLLEHLSGAGE